VKLAEASGFQTAGMRINLAFAGTVSAHLLICGSKL
jgi:hypothetical protein